MEDNTAIESSAKLALEMHLSRGLSIWVVAYSGIAESMGARTTRQASARVCSFARSFARSLARSVHPPSGQRANVCSTASTMCPM